MLSHFRIKRRTADIARMSCACVEGDCSGERRICCNALKCSFYSVNVGLKRRWAFRGQTCGNPTFALPALRPDPVLNLVPDIHGILQVLTWIPLLCKEMPRILGASGLIVSAEICSRSVCAVNQYRRQDVLRILRLPARQLEMWERAGLIEPAEAYAFDGLSQLRKLRELAATRISAQSIRRSMDAMRQVAGTVNPLAGAMLAPHTSRVVFRQSGALLDPLSDQLAFDFEIKLTAALAVVRQKVVNPTAHALRLLELFQRAVRLEERPETLAEAKALYGQLLELEPMHAAGAINLGTIRYNERDFAGAEELYRLATEADPEYALAFFDLGNVLDEQMRLTDAVQAYERALELVPEYADAHYNLALAYERLGETRKALRHWTAYTRLDASGPWHSHARMQARRILSAERLTIVSRHGRTMRIAG